MNLAMRWIILAGLCLASDAYAGAWTQDKGKGLAIVNASFSYARAYYDNAGDRIWQPTYYKYELNPYLEYGLWDGVTIGTNISLQRVHNTFPMETNWGVGDSEFFARFRLFQQDGFVFSAEPMVKLRSPDSEDDNLPLGGAHEDTGLGLSAGYGFSAYGLNHFINLDTQYRYRFGNPKDQLKIAATAGASITPQIMIMPQAFYTRRMDSPAFAVFTQSSGDDYNLLKLQLSTVYKMNDELTFQFGSFGHISGKNTGAGQGFTFSVWRAF